MALQPLPAIPVRTGAVIAAGLDHSDSAFPRFLQTWNSLIDAPG